MKQTKTVRVDGEEYLLADWPVDMATELWAFLIATLGPSVKTAFQTVVSVGGAKGLLDVDMQSVKELGAEVGIDVLDGVLKDLARVLPPEEYSRRMKQIFSEGILYKGAPLNANVHFARRLKHMHLVALEVLKHQYADFLEGVPLIFGSFTKAPADTLHSAPVQ